MQIFILLKNWVLEILWGEDSSRSAAILRIGLVLIVWAKYAGKMRLFISADPDRMFLGLLFFLLTPVLLIGLCSRVAAFLNGILLFVMYYYLGEVQGYTDDFIHHHTYLLSMSVLLLGFTPCGKSYSLDRVLAVRRAKQKGRPVPEEKGASWGLKLIAFQASMVYFWGAVDKTRVAFLDGTEMEFLILYLYTGSDYPVFPGIALIAAAVGTGTVVLEYILALGLWFERFQLPLIISGILFHAGIYLTAPVSTFSVTICLLYIAFVRPARVHALTEGTFYNWGQQRELS
jgi:hypothetical protein